MNIYDKCLTIRSISDMARKPAKKARFGGEEGEVADKPVKAVAVKAKNLL